MKQTKAERLQIQIRFLEQRLSGLEVMIETIIRIVGKDTFFERFKNLAEELKAEREATTKTAASEIIVPESKLILPV